jgi:membrane protease YdiL (CAAX protease family)
VSRARRTDDPWPRFVPVLWLLGTWLGIGAVCSLFAHVGGDESPTSDAVFTGVGAVLVTCFALTELEAMRSLLRVRHLRLRALLEALAAFAVIAVVVTAWFELAATMFETVDYLAPFRDHGWPPWTAVLLVVVMPAIFEEIAFRGFLQERLGALMGVRDALLLQAAWFAFLHLSPFVFPSHFVMGLCFGWLRLRTGSVVPSMVVHAAWNLTVLLQEGLLPGW